MDSNTNSPVVVVSRVLAWVAGLGFGGMVIGAFIDRSRR